MSAPGPESVPTSADPRSHRPTKKRALTPLSAQAASLDALFARPDQNIRVPSSDGNKSTRPPPPEIVTNVQGSSAGAGSGEFHVYKASRRREYERLREMDEEVKRAKEQSEFVKEKAERDRRDEERTKKNREKREKMKARRAQKGKGGANAGDKKRPVRHTTQGEGHQEDGAQEGNGNVSSNAIDGEEKPAVQPAGLVIHDDD